jgi:hypothetical protein
MLSPSHLLTRFPPSQIVAQVGIQVVIRRIYDVESLHQSFTCALTVFNYWIITDPDEHETNTKESKLLKEKWSPQTKPLVHIRCSSSPISTAILLFLTANLPHAFNRTTATARNAVGPTRSFRTISCSEK